jgi:mannose-1-phosphate guanylyltransferase
LLQFHREHGGQASIVVTAAAERQDVGWVEVDAQGRVTSFQEKTGKPVAPGRFTNAGVYVLQRKAVEAMPFVSPFSLEHQVFPALAGAGQCFAMPIAGDVIDIGTPQRLETAQRSIRANVPSDVTHDH